MAKNEGEERMKNRKILAIPMDNELYAHLDNLRKIFQLNCDRKITLAEMGRIAVEKHWKFSEYKIEVKETSAALKQALDEILVNKTVRKYGSNNRVEKEKPTESTRVSE